MMKLALVFVAALAIGVKGQATNYSALCTNQSEAKHTACKSPISSGVSAADIKTILDTHNTLRSRVALGNETLGAPGPQPQAANMLKLVWNKDLAEIAQRWADQCEFNHDTCRKVSHFQSIGQNIYEYTSPANGSVTPWNEIINIWYKEVTFYDKKSVVPYSYTPRTGHYTQVVWADTYLIGCGLSQYKKHTNPVHTSLFVCNYGPGGNIAGSNMYIKGTPCSKCPSGTVCSNGLCK